MNRKVSGSGKKDLVIALAGNPNVGKSSLFNALTGMNQHTGNWPGKTVASASGSFETADTHFEITDIPGTYSLCAHSAEEEAARDSICFGRADAVVIVCDASCLERNLTLALQIMETGSRCAVCVNLIDEAKRRGIVPDTALLSEKLSVPVAAVCAHSRKTLKALVDILERADRVSPGRSPAFFYPPALETAVSIVGCAVRDHAQDRFSVRWLAVRLLENEKSTLARIDEELGFDIVSRPGVSSALCRAREYLASEGFDAERTAAEIALAPVREAGRISAGVVARGENSDALDRRLDRIVTGKASAFPIMLLLLLIVFWITIVGANYPSQLLFSLTDMICGKVRELLAGAGSPEWLISVLCDGALGVLGWVVSVMLPPMAVFFPLFSLLEDSGYLPRIAYNLDKPFKCCKACGKQALTMCMGFGCNAVGITGCRIIDSPRERLIAILTNNFSPCNGRFPLLITLGTVFFAGAAGGTFTGALMLTAVIVFGAAATLLVSRLLSATLLKGMPSSFTLELPPYRKPQIIKTVVRSFLDRTVFVLGRAAAVAAPAGIVIWIFANIDAGGISLLKHLTDALDPFAEIFGLDGVILAAFILGIPANETVLPIMLMAYTASGTLCDADTAQLSSVLAANGWTVRTAVCVMIFTLMHWPCTTALLTVKKETGSIRWTIAAFLIPTAAGLLCCFLFNSLCTISGAFA